MSILTLIIKREFISKVRNKSFIVMTFLSPLLLVAIAVIIAYLSGMKSDTKTIAIHDQSGLFVNEFKSDSDFNYLDLSTVDMQILRDSVTAKRYEGIIFIPKETNLRNHENSIEYISNDSPATSYINSVEDKIEQKLTNQNLTADGLDLEVITKAQAKVNLNLVKVTGGESVKGLNEIKVAIGGAFGYLIMMFIIIYGNMVMRSVIEEKTNRIVEIIISSVKPFQLMMGKIIGTSMAGVLQFIIWAVIGIVLLFGISMFLDVDVTKNAGGSPEMMAAAQAEAGKLQLYIAEMWNLPIATILIMFLIYFIGGYFLYSSFYAAIGAAVDSDTDAQQFLIPIIMPLMLAIYIGFFAVLKDPNGTVATAFSIIPLTSPIVMMMRIPFGVPLWQLALSVALLFGTFFLTVWVAAKIYRVGILMHGKKPTWKEMYKWLKY